VKRLARLEARSGGGWYVAEVGADWQGDVRAALGLALGDSDILVIIKQFGDPNTPPRLVSQQRNYSAASQSRGA
jgi:hypothetical protein